MDLIHRHNSPTPVQPGQCELLLTCLLREDGVAILRCASASDWVRLPTQVLGRPVTELGDYALSPRAPAKFSHNSILVRVTCGGPDPTLYPEQIRRVELPVTLSSIGDYAFYGCERLEELTLLGPVSTVGGDTLMNCRALCRVVLNADGGGRSCLGAILGQRMDELEVSLTLPNQKTALLYFPAYSEEMELLAAPHIFQTRITGGGYAYRQCVQNGILSLTQYDACLPQLLARHDFSSASRVALSRLLTPVDLSPFGGQTYQDVLRQYGGEAALDLVERGDIPSLNFLLKQDVLSPGALLTVGDAARRLGRTEALALLLAQRPAPGKTAKTYDL